MKVDGSSAGVGGSADGGLAGVAAALALRTVDRRGQGSSGQLLPLVDDLSADASDRCRVVHVVVGTAGSSDSELFHGMSVAIKIMTSRSKNAPRMLRIFVVL